MDGGSTTLMCSGHHQHKLGQLFNHRKHMCVLSQIAKIVPRKTLYRNCPSGVRTTYFYWRTQRTLCLATIMIIYSARCCVYLGVWLHN